MATIKFGTDGWRGIIAWDFTFENVYLLAQAMADYINANAPVLENGKMPKIFVGYDRRFMSDKFAADIAAMTITATIQTVFAKRLRLFAICLS